MTLPELRALAEKAKAWFPVIHCENRYSVSQSSCDTCDPCLGAKRAAEDVARLIDCVLVDVSGFIKNRDADDRHASIWYSDAAARIESYFGAPGVVAAFAAAKREFCA